MRTPKEGWESYKKDVYTDRPSTESYEVNSMEQVEVAFYAGMIAACLIMCNRDSKCVNAAFDLAEESKNQIKQLSKQHHK